MQNIQYKPLPEVILARAIHDGWHAIELSCNPSRDDIQEVYVSLVDHLGGAQKHVLLIAEGLHEEGEKLVNGIITCFEELGVDHEADNLFNQIMGDTIPSIFAETTLLNLKNTVRS